MSDPCADLELYHHRGLDAPRRGAFEAHLRRCPSCRAELEALREMDDVLRSALAEGQAEPSWDALAARVRRRIDGAPRRRARLPWVVGAASAAAAAAIVLVAVLASRPSAPAPAAPVAVKEPPPPPAAAPAPEPPPPAPPKAAPPAESTLEEKAAPAAPRAAEPKPDAPKPPAAAPAPAPEAVSPPPKPAPSRTVAVRARLERVKGTVLVAQARAVEGQDVLSGQEIVTEGAGSLAVLGQSDATRLEIGAESRVSFPEAKPAVHLDEGKLTIDAPEGAGAEEGLCTTAHAEVRYQGTRFTLTASPAQSRLEVLRGTAEFLNLADGTSRQVRAGQLAFAQAHPGVDQRRVDEAIRKGVEFLKTADSPTWSLGPKDSDELILLTFIHAGVAEGDPKFQQLLKKILDAPLETTYEVAVQAMALEELHRVKHQARIAQCAQFLVDNQCRNGQWSYGKPTVAASDPSVPTGGSGADAPSGRPGVREFDSGFERREKPKVTRRIPVRRTREGPAAGDNSNSQYAALGLRACHDAGILLPKDVIQLAKKWWVDSAIGDPKGGKNEAVATGAGKIHGVPQGWCYRGYHHDLKYCKNPDQAYASMTAGAVGALTIYDYILGVDWKKDKTVLNGMVWLAKNWSVTENIGPSEIGGSKPKTWLCYYLYAIERAGVLFDTAKIGDAEWYPEGANLLLDAQKPNGSWALSVEMSAKPTWDTCFAILFLKKATRPLDVASEDKLRK